MPPLRARAQLAFPAVLFLTAVVALLPAQRRLGWSRDFAEIIRFPLRPFAHAGNTLAGWLRPAPSVTDVGDQQDLEQLVEELELTRRRYHDEHEQRLRLQEQLRQLQQIPARNRTATKAAVFAYITRRSTATAVGIAELKLEPGATAIIEPGTVAVYASVHLLGRVVGEPRATTCELLPLANAATGYIRGCIVPREDPLRPSDEAPRIQLAPTGTGALVGELDRDKVVEIGDVVRLVDDRWPPTAQMMVLGEVEDVATNDREPLRNTITVRPRYQVQQVSYVTLLVEHGGGPAPVSDAPETTP